MTIREVRELYSEGAKKGMESVKRWLGKGQTHEAIQALGELKGNLQEFWNVAAAQVASSAIRKPLGEQTEEVYKGYDEFLTQIFSAVQTDTVDDGYDAVVIPRNGLEVGRTWSAFIINSPYTENVLCFISEDGAYLIRKEEGFDFEIFCRQLDHSFIPGNTLVRDLNDRSFIAYMDLEGSVTARNERYRLS